MMKITLQDLIKRCGGQSAAAKVCGVHRQTVHHWHTGRSAPSWPLFVKLCNHVGVDPRTVELPKGGA